MDTATLNGKTYVRAAKAAADAGYTTDYVGQLCRQGKLDAVVLGKAWYVREGAVAEHKRSHTQRNVGTTRRELARRAQEEIARRNSTSAPARHGRPELVSPVRYIPDDGALLPIISHAEKGAERLSATEATEDTAAPLSLREAAAPPYFNTSKTTRAYEAVEENGHNSEETSEYRVPSDAGAGGAANEGVRDGDTPTAISVRRIRQAGAQSADGAHSRTWEVRNRRESKAPSPSAAAAPGMLGSPQERVVAEQPNRAVVLRRSKLPMVLAAALVLVLAASVLVEGRLVYTEIAGEAAVQAEYGLASIGTLIEDVQHIRWPW